MSGITRILNTKNNAKIIAENFIYNQSAPKVLRSDPFVSCWACHRQKKGCKGRIRVKDDAVIRSWPHSHPAEPDECQLLLRRQPVQEVKKTLAEVCNWSKEGRWKEVVYLGS